MIAERALVGGVRARIQVARPVGTCLDAVAAPDAVVMVHEHHPVLTLERGADRADLHAWWMVAVIAQLGHEEGPQDLLVGCDRRESFHTAVRAIHLDLAVRVNDVAFYPGPEVVRLVRHVVLGLAGLHALPAADALLDADAHRVVVLARVIPILVLSCQQPDRPDHAEQNRGTRELQQLGQELSSLVSLRHLSGLG